MYEVTLDNTIYRYRAITIGEYRGIYNDIENSIVIDDRIYTLHTLIPPLEDRVVRLCLISPEIDYDNGPGRLITSLCNYILSSSMLMSLDRYSISPTSSVMYMYRELVDTNSDREIDEYIGRRTELLRKRRNKMGGAYVEDKFAPIIVSINNAFPTLDPVVLGKMECSDLLDLYALAMYKLGSIDDSSEKSPSTIPTGLSPSEAQQFKENAAAKNSEIELRKAMEEARKGKK